MGFFLQAKCNVTYMVCPTKCCNRSESGCHIPIRTQHRSHPGEVTIFFPPLFCLPNNPESSVAKICGRSRPSVRRALPLVTRCGLVTPPLFDKKEDGYQRHPIFNPDVPFVGSNVACTRATGHHSHIPV